MTALRPGLNVIALRVIIRTLHRRLRTPIGGIVTAVVLAIEAASRAVDKACNRRFGLVASPEARIYTAEYHRTLGRWVIDVDDVQTTAG
jgi:hypothetical protein